MYTNFLLHLLGLYEYSHFIEFRTNKVRLVQTHSY